MTEKEEREQLARIDKALAEVDLALAHAALEREQLRQMQTIDLDAKLAGLRQLQTIDLDAKLRSYRLEPWRVFILGFGGLGAWSAFLIFALAHWWKP